MTTVHAILFSALASFAISSHWQQAVEKADAMLKEIDALQPPAGPSEDTDAAWEAWSREFEAYAMRRGEMAVSFYKAYPDHDRTPKLMEEHFSLLLRVREPEAAIRELEAFLSTGPKGSVEQSAWYYLSQARFDRVMNPVFEAPEPDRRTAASQALAVIDAFTARYPKDDRAARLLMRLADLVGEPSEAVPLFSRIVVDYPDSRAAPFAKGKLKQAEGIGKPFELEFADAVTGDLVTMEGLRGKVVLVDFWATWCGPCRAKMPMMKELYARYREAGLEIIGVSLDAPESEGGLTSLLDYVKAEGIGWLHFYQGKGWDGEFSRAWGINSIPTLFLVDRKGVLRHVDARDDTMGKVERLLAEAG